ncbi:MAG: hypothetical protein O3B24_08460 [Verrucomicrobia bacterium]|nr:hypothetical protein [Verrucomicrobiota bacterium]
MPQTVATAKPPHTLAALCRGEPTALLAQFAKPARALLLYAIIITFGAGIYGATIGLWRAPQQAVFTAIKFPLLIALTTTANALLNGILAQGLGLRIGFRQSFLAITASFAIASLILASLSPVTLFLLANTPPLGTGSVHLSHSFMLLAHVALIALAGTIGNLALYRLLLAQAADRATARRVLLAWLIGNVFLGCQLSWIMRPFIGAPQLPVEFFRAEAFQGNFYESVFRSLQNVL